MLTTGRLGLLTINKSPILRNTLTRGALENVAPALTSRARLEQCPGEAEVERREMLLTIVLQGPR